MFINLTHLSLYTIEQVNTAIRIGKIFALVAKPVQEKHLIYIIEKISYVTAVTDILTEYLK